MTYILYKLVRYHFGDALLSTSSTETCDYYYNNNNMVIKLEKYVHRILTRFV